MTCKSTALFVVTALFSLSMLTALGTAPAQAQATRTFVSGVGDDANPCARTSPCKTFAGAIAKTSSSGEIDCLDPGGFGGLTITKPISIICDGVSNGGVLVAGTNGITVALSSAGNVVLSGLDFEGLSPASGAGLNGVAMTGVGNLTIRNSTIRDFKTNGVFVQPSSATSPAPRVVIINCLITNNGTTSTANSGGVTFAGSVTTNGEIQNSVIDANFNYALGVNSLNSVVVEASVLTGTPAGALSISGTGQVISYQNNVFRNGVGPTSNSPLQ